MRHYVYLALFGCFIAHADKLTPLKVLEGGPIQIYKTLCHHAEKVVFTAKVGDPFHQFHGLLKV